MVKELPRHQPARQQGQGEGSRASRASPPEDKLTLGISGVFNLCCPLPLKLLFYLSTTEMETLTLVLQSLDLPVMLFIKKQKK